MASLTIRNIDEPLKRRLRIQAAHNGRSMEEEVRQILRQALENGVPAGEISTQIVPPRIAPSMATPAAAAPRPLTLAAPAHPDRPRLAPEPSRSDQRMVARADRPLFATSPASSIGAGLARPETAEPAETLLTAPPAARPIETGLVASRLEFVGAEPSEDLPPTPLDAPAAKPESRPTAAPPLSVEAFTDGLRQRLALLVGLEAPNGRRT